MEDEIEELKNRCNLGQLLLVDEVLRIINKERERLMEEKRRLLKNEKYIHDLSTYLAKKFDKIYSETRYRWLIKEDINQFKKKWEAENS